MDTSLDQWRNSPQIRITFSGQADSCIYTTTQNSRMTMQQPQLKFLRVGGMSRNDSIIAKPYSVALVTYKIQLFIGFENIAIINLGSSSGDVGGCIEVANIAGISFRNVTMANYRAQEGGAVYLYNIGQVVIENSNFGGNSAINGGGLFISSVGDVTIKRSVFYDNHADNIGGAVVIESARSVAIQQGNRFVKNVAVEYGGAVAINNVAMSTIIRTSYFISNKAKVGSAIVMSKCGGSEVSGNSFDGNEASVGIVYWVASSGMAAPFEGAQSHQFGNANRCRAYGCGFATEFAKIKTIPGEMLVDNYDPSVYSVEVRVSLVDYYDTVVKSESQGFVEVRLASYFDARCSINNDYSKVTGNLAAEIVEGMASFSSLSGVCFPGGYMNVTFSRRIQYQPRPFPQYLRTEQLGSLISSNTGGVSRSQPKLVISSLARLSFRSCRRGEIVDLKSRPYPGMCRVCTDSYSLRDNSNNSITECTACPVGALHCEGTYVLLAEGYWRWNANAATVFECPFKNGCRGGNSTGELLCNKGYTGPRCGVCAAHYYRSLLINGCETCEGSLGVSFGVVAAVLVIAAVSIMYFGRKYYSLSGASFDSMIEAWSDADLNPNVTEILQKERSKVNAEKEKERDKGKGSGEGIRKSDEKTVNKKERGWKLSILLKIIITAMQIISQCPVKFSLQVLPLFSSLWLIFDKFNFDFINLIPISCYTSYGYLDSMFYLSFTPICISLFLVATYHVQIYLYRWQHPNELEQDRLKREAVYRQYYTTIFLIMTYFILPTVAVKVMSTFRCIDVDLKNESTGYIERHGSTLRLGVDFSVDCKSNGYLWMYTWAVAMSVTYIGVIPSMYYLLLRHNRDIITNRSNKAFLLTLMATESGRKRIAFVKSLEFIYGAYKPQFWYWEVRKDL